MRSPRAADGDGVGPSDIDDRVGRPDMPRWNGCCGRA